MSTINLPPIVNDQGNITVHKDEGCKIIISVQDDTGADIDASGIPLFFISNAFRKALDQDPNDTDNRMVTLTPTDVNVIVHGASFRVVDETDPTQPVIRWEGRIYKRG